MVAATALGPHTLIAVEDGTFGERLVVHSRMLHNLPKGFRMRVYCGVKENIVFAGNWNGFRVKDDIDPDNVFLCTICFGSDDDEE